MQEACSHGKVVTVRKQDLDSLSFLLYVKFPIAWIPGLPFPSLIYLFLKITSSGSFLVMDAEVSANVFVQASP